MFNWVHSFLWAISNDHWLTFSPRYPHHSWIIHFNIPSNNFPAQKDTFVIFPNKKNNIRWQHFSSVTIPGHQKMGGNKEIHFVRPLLPTPTNRKGGDKGGPRWYSQNFCHTSYFTRRAKKKREDKEGCPPSPGPKLVSDVFLGQVNLKVDGEEGVTPLEVWCA